MDRRNNKDAKRDARLPWNPVSRFFKTMSIVQRVMIIPVVLILSSALTHFIALGSSDKVQGQVHEYVDITSVLPKVMSYTVLFSEVTQVANYYLNDLSEENRADIEEHLQQLAGVSIELPEQTPDEVKATVATLLDSRQALKELVRKAQEHPDQVAEAKQEVRSLVSDRVEPLTEALSNHIQSFMSEEKTMLEKEQHNETVLLWTLLIAGTLLTLLLVSWSTYTVAAEVKRVEEAMDGLSEGDNEADYITFMRGNMRAIAESFAKLKGYVNEAARLQRVVEQSPQPTMLVDRESLNITYVNGAAKDLFRSIQHGLSCTVDQLVGKRVDVIHSDASLKPASLSNQSAFPLRSQIKLADKSIAFTADAILNAAGDWDSIMVSWSDVTEGEILANEFEGNVGVLVQDLIAASSQMQGASETLSSMAEQSAAQASSVSSGASEANQNVMTVASAAEELAASIAEITRQVEDAVRMSGQAVDEADSTNRTVTKLSTASEEIGEVVRVITDIAEQTNLLALNASIEAARAGEAGRGFAVVAGEVKELANQTARATQKISEQIAAIQSESTGAAKAIEHIGSTIRRMNEINRAVSAATEEQNGATREIAQSVHYASDATQRVTEAIGGVSEAAVDTGRSASDVLAASGDIRNKAEGLQQHVQSFLNSLRHSKG